MGKTSIYISMTTKSKGIKNKIGRPKGSKNKK